ncbi:MAG: GTPase [Planctomycetota bacterium]
MTDVELLTAHGAGGVAVIAVRGAAALARLASLAGGRTAEPGEVRFARLIVAAAGAPSGALELDEALLVGVRAAGGQAAAPSTGSGARPEPLVELHVHGSPPLVDELLELLRGAPSAAPDEPPSADPRALDLGGSAPRSVAALAAERLADVPTELGARVLVDQWGGGAGPGALARLLDRLRGEGPAARRARLAALCARSAALSALFSPPRVVLSGPVNAGKSTLFNLLAGEERALVSDVPGTTRDAQGASVPLGVYAMRLVDTAGARELPASVGAEDGDQAVERAGQALAQRLLAGADVVVELRRADAVATHDVDQAPSRAGLSGASAPQRTQELQGVPRVSLVTCADLLYGGEPDDWPITEAAPRAAHFVSAAVAPRETRARVEALLHSALRLAPEPNWVPGEPVLFERAHLALARELAAGDVADAALRRFARALGLALAADEAPA